MSDFQARLSQALKELTPRVAHSFVDVMGDRSMDLFSTRRGLVCEYLESRDITPAVVHGDGYVRVWDGPGREIKGKMPDWLILGLRHEPRTGERYIDREGEIWLKPESMHEYIDYLDNLCRSKESK